MRGWSSPNRANWPATKWAVDCEGFTLYVDAASVPWLDDAEIDFVTQGAGSQLTIKAPHIKGKAPAEGASLVERVRWVVEHEVNPQLASHGGRVAVEEVTAEGRGVPALRRWLPRLRHGRCHPEAGHREDPADARAGRDRGA